MKRIICFFTDHIWNYVSTLIEGKSVFTKHCTRCKTTTKINQGEYLQGKTSIFKS